MRAVPFPDGTQARPGAGTEAVPLGPRPYALTGGRTEPQLDLAVEALVTTVTDATARTSGVPGWPGVLTPEHSRILALCAAPTSVAEVSALLGLPLGVARVLVSDLAVQGLVTVYRPTDGHPAVALMERVLDGLRRL